MKMHFCSAFIYKQCLESVYCIRIAESFQNKFFKDKKEDKNIFFERNVEFPQKMHDQLMFSIFKLVWIETFNVVSLMCFP